MGQSRCCKSLGQPLIHATFSDRGVAKVEALPQSARTSRGCNCLDVTRKEGRKAIFEQHPQELGNCSNTPVSGQPTPSAPRRDCPLPHPTGSPASHLSLLAMAVLQPRRRKRRLGEANGSRRQHRLNHIFGDWKPKREGRAKPASLTQLPLRPGWPCLLTPPGLRSGKRRPKKQSQARYPPPVPRPFFTFWIYLTPCFPGTSSTIGQKKMPPRARTSWFS